MAHAMAYFFVQRQRSPSQRQGHAMPSHYQRHTRPKVSPRYQTSTIHQRHTIKATRPPTPRHAWRQALPPRLPRQAKAKPPGKPPGKAGIYHLGLDQRGLTRAAFLLRPVQAILRWT